MRQIRRHLRRLFVTELENRCTPAILVSVAGNDVVFTGDAGNDALSLSADTGGFLKHSLPVSGNLASSIDLDSATPGVQSRLISSLSSLAVDLAAGVNSVSFTDLAAPVALSNVQTVILTLSGGADAALTDAGVSVSDVASPYSYSLATTPAVARVIGGTGANVFDASAVTAYNVWLIGQDGADILRGGALPDRLEGGNGDDELSGNGGSDNSIVYANLGTNGGLYGGAGNDKLLGGEGDDHLADIGPNAAANGGPGIDYFFSSAIASAVITDSSLTLGTATNAGNEFESIWLDGASGGAVLDASALTTANVRFRGASGTNILRGGALSDWLESGPGYDELYGNGGNDSGTFLLAGVSVAAGLYGSYGNDLLDGGDGDDYLTDTQAGGTVVGGAGNDYYFDNSYAYSAVITDTTLTTISTGTWISNNHGLESIRLRGTLDADTFDASALATASVWFEGLAGNDTLLGGAQRDRLDGGDGNDLIHGNEGDDNALPIPLTGQSGGLFGGNGNNQVYGGNGNDTVGAGPGTNLLDGQAGFDSVEPSATGSNDVIQVADGSVTINGAISTYLNAEALTVDAGGGYDKGTQIGATHPLAYVVKNLEPTVSAGPDEFITQLPFTLQRTGSFTDIGSGQSWTAQVYYGDNSNPQPLTVDSITQTFTLNHTYQTAGRFSVYVYVTDNLGSINGDVFYLTEISGGVSNGPVTIGSGFNGISSRSRVTEVHATFNEIMTLNPGFFVFERLPSIYSGPMPSVSFTTSVVNGGTRVTFTFSGTGTDPGNALQNGRYRLTLLGANILTPLNQSFDGNGDGMPGGNASLSTYRLFGDVDNNRTIDAIDLAELGKEFGHSDVNSHFNYIGNGYVDSEELAVLGASYGFTL